MIYFSIFTNQDTLNLSFEELNTDFVKPLSKFMHSKADMMLRNQQILMSKYLPKMMLYIQAFLNTSQKRSPEFIDFLKSSNITSTIGVVLNRFSHFEEKSSNLEFASEKVYSFKKRIEGQTSKLIPESVLTIPHGRAVETFYYRNINFRAEDYYWMENHNKVNEHKDKIEEFRPKYEEEYESVWEPQFYQTVNFRTVWYDACNLFISSQKAKQIVEKEYRQAAQHLYSSMLQGNSDAMAMFDFTFF